MINIKDEILELLILFYFSDNNIDDNIKQQFRNYIDKLKNLFYLNLFDKENYIKRVLIFLLGVFIIAMDYNLIVVPNNFVIGGASGLSIVLNKILKYNQCNFRQ